MKKLNKSIGYLEEMLEVEKRHLECANNQNRNYYGEKVESLELAIEIISLFNRGPKSITVSLVTEWMDEYILN